MIEELSNGNIAFAAYHKETIFRRKKHIWLTIEFDKGKPVRRILDKIMTK